MSVDEPYGLLDDPSSVEFIPTPEDIAAACAEIQAGWSDRERFSRYVGPKSRRWSVPGINRGHNITDRDAMQTFLGTGGVVPVSNGRCHPGDDANPPAMPFDD